MLLSLPLSAGAAILDFEGLSVGTFLANEFQNSGIVFTQNAKVHDLGVNHATSGVLGLFDGGATIEARFMLPGNRSATTDHVSIKGDLIPIAGVVYLRAYDLFDNLVDEDVQPDIPAPASLMVSGRGIHRISFFSESRTVAFDDLSFNTPVPVSAVPEPASVVTLLSGAAGLLLTNRLRRHR